ncbi:MAG: succinate dehydrogenase / fumarate reductase cytochrome b subunit [Saprospiraceae bacterium]|jgi:succinate dehydrogenase / fumarate reductase cytochrome b subunit
MKWLINFFTSSIGRKLIMSFTGLFLILFLVVHLIGNLQLLKDDGGVAFNAYAYFMTNNPLIKTVAYGNYFFIILHAFMGILISFKNKAAKGSTYAVRSNAEVTWASKNMALLGTLILAFIFIHMGDFWFKMKMDVVPYVAIEGMDHKVKDLYAKVSHTFANPWMVAAYVVGLATLSFHLWHGFQSAFQTLGINHPKYTPIIKGLGKLYAVIVPFGFAIIPLYYFFVMK